MNEDYRGYTIEVSQDEDAESPRNWETLGTMCCEHRRYQLGDGGQELLYAALVKDDRWQGLKKKLEPTQHGSMFKLAEKWGYVVLPIYMMDHSGLSFNTTNSNFKAQDPQGWDWGLLGFIFCTDKQALDFDEKSDVNRRLSTEVELYDQWYNGGVTRYDITKKGKDVSSCGGFYDDTALQTAKEYLDILIQRPKKEEAPHKEYLVTWTVELAAASPDDAAREALNIQRDGDSQAIFFQVTDKETKTTVLVELPVEE